MKKNATPNLWDMSEPVSGPMVRAQDPVTSHQAAELVEPTRNKIQAAVLHAYREHGEMSARQAERLPEFRDYGFSTIRKRISELHRSGQLEDVGKEYTGRAPATIYHIATQGTEHDEARSENP